MGLNDKQKEAVLHAGGPLLVQAGPGSGKTRVIIERVLHLVDAGVAPESILCMTFTEKATDEMSRRLHEKKVDGVTANPMHAMCLEMLKENSPITGITEKTAVQRHCHGGMVRPQHRQIRPRPRRNQLGDEPRQ